MEIQLASKRKLGFVTGTDRRSTTDASYGIQWDTCNNMVISWLHNNVSESIKKSILFVNSAAAVWKVLEQRFQLTNGSRKYKLNRDLFNIKQNGQSLVEYYTAISAIWEEIDVMNTLPSIITSTDEITVFLKAIETQKQESKLFQFLNGLDECYGNHRSQLLMMNPLPLVEMACSVVQQEESQRENVKNQTHELAVMYNKTENVKNQISGSTGVCPECGRKGHTTADCWKIIGYPKWHNKHNRKPVTNFRTQDKSTKMANIAQGGCDSDSEDSTVSLTTKQLEQLLRMLPSKTQHHTDQDLDSPFSGMVFCSTVQNIGNVTEWIADSGATDHMTSNISLLSNVKSVPSSCTIKLPTGDTVVISHVGCDITT